MSKKNIFLVSVIAILIFGATGIYLFLNLRKINTEKVGSALSNIVSDISPRATADKIYEDSSGFSFSYPKGVEVTDITPDNNSYYSMLKISYRGNELRLSVTDTSFTKADQWVKSKQAPDGLELVGAASLGGVQAIQYKSSDSLYTVAVDNGALFLFEGPLDGGFMEEMQNVIVGSFLFADQARSTGDVDENVIYEDEEVVE